MLRRPQVRESQLQTALAALGREGRRVKPPLEPAKTRSETPADIGQVLQQSHLPVLDGFRALSAIVVVADHAEFVPTLGSWKMHWGGMGVTMFFVLSGFLITWLLLREHSVSGRIALRDFYVRRMLRIWPAYYAYIVVAFLLRHYLNPQEAWRPLGPPLLTSLTLTYNYFKAFGGMTHLAIDQLWTVSVEEQFYFVWPAVLILLLRRGRERAVLAVSSAIVLVLVWRCVLYLGFGVSWRYIYTAFDTRADALAMGCLLALLSASPAFLRLARTMIRTPLMPLLPLGILVVNESIPGSYHWTMGPTVEAACTLVLIVQLLQLYPSRRWSWL